MHQKYGIQPLPPLLQPYEIWELVADSSGICHHFTFFYPFYLYISMLFMWMNVLSFALLYAFDKKRTFTFLFSIANEIETASAIYRLIYLDAWGYTIGGRLCGFSIVFVFCCLIHFCCSTNERHFQRNLYTLYQFDCVLAASVCMGMRQNINFEFPRYNLHLNPVTTCRTIGRWLLHLQCVFSLLLLRCYCCFCFICFRCMFQFIRFIFIRLFHLIVLFVLLFLILFSMHAIAATVTSSHRNRFNIYSAGVYKDKPFKQTE